ncbi:MAG: ABC transporter permease, partial [Dermatophilaceae bacterium]
MTDAADAMVSATAAGLGENRSPASAAWRAMRRNPLFWLAAVLISVFTLMAVWPGLFTSTDPTAAVLREARSRPGEGTWFGRDLQGYDIYARCIYGARASILVGLLATTGTALVGGLVGVLAGYLGGVWDAVLSRIGDIFVAIPVLLGSIIVLVSLPQSSSYLVIVLKVVLALVLLGWPSTARLMRSSVIQVLPNDYVQAAR